MTIVDARPAMASTIVDARPAMASTIVGVSMDTGMGRDQGIEEGKRERYSESREGVGVRGY